MQRLVLFQPDIPQNTGSMLRLAACLGVAVDLIEPAGFLIDDRRMRRAGMDYLDHVRLVRHASWDAYLSQAQVLVAEKRPADALAAINQGIAMGARNLHVAYYSRGEIEEDAGRLSQAYRDYRRALTIKPDYAPALRQLERFRVVPKNRATQ